jgi:hypothetical protein
MGVAMVISARFGAREFIFGFSINNESDIPTRVNFQIKLMK